MGLQTEHAHGGRYMPTVVVRAWKRERKIETYFDVSIYIYVKIPFICIVNCKIYIFFTYIPKLRARMLKLLCKYRLVTWGKLVALLTLV